MRRKATSTPESKEASMAPQPSALGDLIKREMEGLTKALDEQDALLANAVGGGPFFFDPLNTPAHRRALRESARLELRQWEERWLRMGADPESMAEACEGARVRLMSEARARGKQG